MLNTLLTIGVVIATVGIALTVLFAFMFVIVMFSGDRDA